MFTTIWILTNVFVNLFDFGFLVLRPRSLPGGDLSHIWSFYNEHYVPIDPKYADVNNSLPLIMTWLTTIESVVYLYALIKYKQSSKQFWFIVGMLSFAQWWKTLAYIGSDAIFGFPHNNLAEAEFWIYFALPSLPWLIVPLMLVCRSYTKLVVESSKVKKN